MRGGGACRPPSIPSGKTSLLGSFSNILILLRWMICDP
uniref:Uncharacterized protein n=1 Tax=Caudovirales sp. ctCVG11 TaxID=2825759 RepID=A0A8S5UAJ7_9CAUD|nr:MAG TPA: hypothetical protein [Caudovirales sp. ctCVG11]